MTVVYRVCSPEIIVCLRTGSLHPIAGPGNRITRLMVRRERARIGAAD